MSRRSGRSSRSKDTRGDLDAKKSRNKAADVQLLLPERLQHKLVYPDLGSNSLLQRVLNNPRIMEASLSEGQLAHFTRTLMDHHAYAHLALQDLVAESKKLILLKATYPNADILKASVENNEWHARAERSLQDCAMSTTDYDSALSLTYVPTVDRSASRERGQKRKYAEVSSSSSDDDEEEDASYQPAPEVNDDDGGHVDPHRVNDFWRRVATYMHTPMIEDLKRLKRDAVLASRASLVIPPLSMPSGAQYGKKGYAKKKPKLNATEEERTGEALALPSSVSAYDSSLLNSQHQALKLCGCTPAVAGHTLAQRLLTSFVAPPQVNPESLLVLPGKKGGDKKTSDNKVPVKPFVPILSKESAIFRSNMKKKSMSDRVKCELQALDLIPPNGSLVIADKDLDPSNRQDDEVCAEMRRLQTELESQIDANNKRRQTLYAMSFKINDRARYLQQLDATEHRINTVWAKKELYSYPETKKGSVPRNTPRVQDREIQDALTARDMIISKVKSRSELTGFFVNRAESAGIPRIELPNYPQRAPPPGVNIYQHHFAKAPSHLFPYASSTNR